MLMDSLFLMIIEDTYFCTKCTIRQIKVDLGNENDIMPVSKRLGKKHFKKRFEVPRNIEAGGIVP